MVSIIQHPRGKMVNICWTYVKGFYLICAVPGSKQSFAFCWAYTRCSSNSVSSIIWPSQKSGSSGGRLTCHVGGVSYSHYSHYSMLFTTCQGLPGKLNVEMRCYSLQKVDFLPGP